MMVLIEKESGKTRTRRTYQRKYCSNRHCACSSHPYQPVCWLEPVILYFVHSTTQKLSISNWEADLTTLM